jgi:histone-lysine N-methyltransferase SETMAR
LLQHDNARPQTSLKTWEAISKFGWTVLPHPFYSPDLAHSDFHLFGALRNDVCSLKFKTDDDVIGDVRTWPYEQDKEWYRQGIHALVSCWCKAVEVDGDFVEKVGFGDEPSHLNMCYFHDF